MRGSTSSRLRSLLAVLLALASQALSFAPRIRGLARELVAGAVTPPILGAVVAAGIAGSKEPEGRVLSFVPRRVQEIMRESRIAWTQYSNFEYIAAGLAVAAMAPGRAKRLLRQQRSGPDVADVSTCTCDGSGCLQGSICDIYYPRQAIDPSPRQYDRLCLFVPGGAWSHGFKSFYTLTSRRLADELGCPVAVGAWAKVEPAAIDKLHPNVSEWDSRCCSELLTLTLILTLILT